MRNCVFPPDALDSSLAFLHKLGYSGSLWEMLIPGNAKRNRNTPRLVDGAGVPPRAKKQDD